MKNPQFAQLMIAVLEKGRPFRFKANGISMAPFIKNGDTLTIVPISGMPTIGSVVAVLTRDGRFFIHRIVGIENGSYLVKGDNIDDVDGWFPKEAICGKVSVIEHNNSVFSFGLGPERKIIACLSKNNKLQPLLVHTRWIYHPFFSRINRDDINSN
jgi:hypothetical protein